MDKLSPNNNPLELTLLPEVLDGLRHDMAEALVLRGRIREEYGITDLKGNVLHSFSYPLPEELVREVFLEDGNPADGGNFVLSAHRFIMGITPEQTLRKSPFYNVDRLQNGDEIIVDYNGKRYFYTISDIFEVKPEDVHIENRTDKPRLTLYSCTLGGAQDGRNVFIATPKS